MTAKRSYTGDTSKTLRVVLKNAGITLRKAADELGCSYGTLLAYTQHGRNIANMKFGMALSLADVLNVYPEEFLLDVKNDKLRVHAENIHDRRGFKSTDYYGIKKENSRLERENYILTRELEFLKLTVAQNRLFNGNDAQAANHEYLQSLTAKIDAEVYHEVQSRVRNDVQAILDYRNGKAFNKK